MKSHIVHVAQIYFVLLLQVNGAIRTTWQSMRDCSFLEKSLYAFDVAWMAFIVERKLTEEIQLLMIF